MHFFSETELLVENNVELHFIWLETKILGYAITGNFYKAMCIDELCTTSPIAFIIFVQGNSVCYNL